MQIQDTDLKLLRIFETIVRCGGFAAAQPVLNIGASSISEYMSQLETRLGLRLCERGRAGFRLTEDGAQLHAAAQRLLSAVDTFHMEAGALRHQLSGVLRFGMIEATLTDRHSPLPLAIRTFGKVAPDVRLQVQIETPGSMEQNVLDARLHLAVGPFPSRIPGLDYAPLYREEQGLYCASTHPLFARAGGRVPAATLAKQRLASRAYLAAEELKLLQMPQAAASVDNVEGRAMLILSGNYIGFLPPHYAQPWVGEGLLARIDPAHYATHLDFHIITRKSGESSRVVQSFCEHLGAAAKEVKKGSAAGGK
ncbi:Transcriptional regulator GbuR [Caballeronia glathei]|uniref:LysR family transcriptional regulator n=1 Tax=Caballeronia glathei TaxID=60547 RepID=A0A069PUQ5_9BURK|nr:LysR family transcriptional regulator [Caballeronia glathei]KDR44275.1 LysR family transcriptional regulator [Caballeronia glathei]CDY77558.1 Transcriptional regulator GbuR [Caballeronia glathei]